jgi:hypothetical protein
MPVVARISTYTFDPSKTELAPLRAEKRRVWAEALQQEPGYLGEVAIDTEDGRQLVIHLWDSHESAEAAKARNNPRLRRLIAEQFEPDYDLLWTRPPEHVMGEVTRLSIGDGAASR